MEQIKEYNEDKIKYVHEENYSEAKRVKEDINKIKQQIEHMVNNFYDPNKKIVNKFTINKGVRNSDNKMRGRSKEKHENQQ